jgi:hypothetical protein
VRPQRSEPDHTPAPHPGRALAWLAGGFALLALLGLLLFPELVGAPPGTLTDLALPLVIAGVPGLVIVLVVAWRRRGTRRGRPGSMR